jgi:Na+/citrate or Na+/malate symporter
VTAWLLLVAASFCLVSLRAFQQLNVIHSKWLWVPFGSVGLAFAEVAVVINVVSIGYIAILFVAFGGVLGCWTSMYLHKKFR